MKSLQVPVHLAIAASISLLDDDLNAYFGGLLSADEQARHASFQQAEDRQRYLLLVES